MKNKYTNKEYFADCYLVSNGNGEAAILMIYEGIYQNGAYFCSLYGMNGERLESSLFSQKEIKEKTVEKFACSLYDVALIRSLGRYDYIYRVLGEMNERPFTIDNKEKALLYIEKSGEYLKYCSEELKSDDDIVSKAIVDEPINIMYANNKYQTDEYSFIGRSKVIMDIFQQVNEGKHKITDYFDTQTLFNNLVDNTDMLKLYFKQEYEKIVEGIFYNPKEYSVFYDREKLDIRKDVVNDYIIKKAQEDFLSKEFWDNLNGDDINLLIDIYNMDFDIGGLIKSHSELRNNYNVLDYNQEFCFCKKQEAPQQNIDMLIVNAQAIKQIERTRYTKASHIYESEIL